MKMEGENLEFEEYIARCPKTGKELKIVVALIKDTPSHITLAGDADCNHNIGDCEYLQPKRDKYKCPALKEVFDAYDN